MRLFLFAFFISICFTVVGQPYPNSTCSNAVQIVSGQNYSYPAWTGDNYAQSGPAYNCLGSQPDPAWFYFLIGSSGDIHIYMYSTPCKDIDFCLWGPFSSLTEGCNGGLTASKVVDCSYSGICSETLDLANCNPGDYYVMVITNYSRVACTVNFSQTSGSGIMTHLPAPVINSNGPVCEGQNLSLTSNPVAGASYSWTGPNGFTSTLQNPIINNISPAQAGTYSCTLGAGSSSGPQSTTQIVVNPLPQPAFVPAASMCQGDSVTIGGNGINGMSYSWISDPPGFSSSLPNPAVMPLTNTQYSLTAILEGCTSSVASTVTVLPLPLALAGPDQVICAGSQALLGGSQVNGSSYIWTSSPPGFTSTLPDPSVSPLVQTVYTLTETNANNCSLSKSVTVSVNPKPTAFTGANQTICNGNATTLGGNAIPGSTYAWTSVPAGFTSSQANPSVSPSVLTTYTLTETNVNNCSQTNTLTVTVNAKPNPVLQNSISCCAGSMVNIGISPVAGNSYAWTSSPAGFSSVNPNPAVNPTIPTVYTLVQTITATGCSKSASVTVNANPLPPAFTGPSQTICNGNSVTLGAAPTAGSQYFWTSNPPGFSANVSNPTVSPVVNTVYILTELKVSTYCMKTNTVIITLLNKPKVQGVLKYDNTNSSGLDSCTIALIAVPGQVVDTARTNNSGNFTIKCIDPGLYRLSPQCDKQWGGVSAIDALQIIRYSVGLVTLSDLRKEAADVNQSHYVNALDAFMVMRRFVGQIDSFPSGDWLIPPVDSSLLTAPANTINFTGLCYGDVNGSYAMPSNVSAQPPPQKGKNAKEPVQINMDEAIRQNQSLIPPNAK